MKNMKFKIWDKKLKVFGYPVKNNKTNKNNKIITLKDKFIIFEKNVYECDKYEIRDIIENDRFILMKYTEVKDKNGKEIFDGDIVKRTVIGYNETIEEIGFINFQNGAFIFNSTAKDKFKTSLYEDLKPYPSKAMPEYEVIGNIYENPELLKGK